MTAPTSPSPGVLDRDDLRIIRALQVAPREGFSRLGTVLGISEVTVARHYRRLREAGVLRVVGVVETSALGESEWIIRVQCRPDGTPAIAEALAGRDDVSWVSINAAGSEVTCSLRSRSQKDREHLLVEMLPRVSTVLNLQASVVMHTFTTECSHEWPAIQQALTPEEVAALRSSPASPPATPTPRLQQGDHSVLRTLATDGRASHTDIGKAAGITPARAARRVRSLLDSGVVRLYVELSRATLGYTTRADLWLQVEPASVRTVGQALATMPEVAFAAATSGVHNIHAAVNCASLNDLFGFVTDRIGSLKGVQAIETSPVLRQLKQFNTLMTRNLLAIPRTPHRDGRT
ncbi:Lrp/AsnC family transcriptional regulator [Streptomyces parvulus]|uniref:Lrp/AsnC family transcriptional regulator n=1 Tax=Streptomyces parvulus TaxID=146923 RepID=UPI0033E95B36